MYMVSLPFQDCPKVHFRALRPLRNAGNKKADAANRPGAFDHVGLLVNEPPLHEGVPLI